MSKKPDPLKQAIQSLDKGDEVEFLGAVTPPEPTPVDTDDTDDVTPDLDDTEDEVIEEDDEADAPDHEAKAIITSTAKGTERALLHTRIRLFLQGLPTALPLSRLFRSVLPEQMADADQARSLKRLFQQSPALRDIIGSTTLYTNCVTRHIDRLLTIELRRVTPEERTQIVEQLGFNASRQLMEAAALLADFTSRACQVEQLRATDPPAAAQAKQQKEKLRSQLQLTLQGVYQELCGRDE